MDRRLGPGLIKCQPERRDARNEVTQWFQGWCSADGVTVRDLASGLHVTTAVARKKLSGESPLSFVDVLQFSGRHRSRLLSDFERHFAQSDDRLFAHG